MTNKLHPDIEKASPKLRDELLSLGMSLERAGDDEKGHITMANLVWERLGPYLSTSKEEEPTKDIDSATNAILRYIDNNITDKPAYLEQHIKGVLRKVFGNILTPEQQYDKPKIEKIDNNSLTKPITLLHKVNECIDTINTQQGQIDYLLSNNK